jgi:hypothetical protein
MVDQAASHVARMLHALALLLLIAATVVAQQPFVTDDADTTPKRHFHFEFSNEYDFLQPASFPSRRQNTADFELDYGLFDRVEVGVELPLLTIYNAPGTGPLRFSGIGDTNVSLKYNFLRERENSRLPAMALSFNVELPTGRSLPAAARWSNNSVPDCNLAPNSSERCRVTSNWVRDNCRCWPGETTRSDQGCRLTSE